MYSSWVNLLDEIIKHGEPRSPRNIPTRELLGVQFKVVNGLANILVHPKRDLNHRFMVAEWLWIMYGTNNVEVIARYNSKIRMFSDNGKILAGAYGPRLYTQLPWVLSKLIESDTRQAVATIWTPCPEPSKDIPCTVALQFLRRDDVINLIVTMRSSDIWLGLPYDYFVFSQVLSCVCGCLNCEVGWVQFNLGSSHLYEDDLEKALGLLDDITIGKSIISQRTPGMPPGWLYEVLVDPINAKVSFSDTAKRYWWRYSQVLKGTRREAIDHLQT